MSEQDLAATEKLPVPSNQDGPHKKRKLKTQLTFARPVFAEEFFTPEAKDAFNKLPAWQRHMIKRIVDHGDLSRAAREAGVSTFVSKNIDGRLAETKTIRDAINAGGITSDDLAYHLKQCLEADCTKFDKHGNPIHMIDMDLKLKTIELIRKLRGDFIIRPESKNDKSAVVDLFNDTEIGDDEKSTGPK